MTISNEILMAYVDGELDPVARADVEKAMRDDPEIERRVGRLRSLTTRIQSAYAAELAEPVPERLHAVLRESSRTTESKIVDLTRPRDFTSRRAGRNQPSRSRWTYVSSIAASLLVAVAAGYVVWHRLESVMIKDVGGSMVAGGSLARDLSDLLAGDTAASTVSIGVSFVARSGDYCRTFSISGGAVRSGLACRHADQWNIEVLTQPTAVLGGSGYRTAGSSLSPAVLAAVQAQIAGNPLDRAAEIAARQQGWRPAEK